MPSVWISSDVLETIAGYVAPPRAKAEYAFALSFEPRDGDYYVERILETTAGSMSSAPTPRVHASAHTHYIENYRDQQCHVGWPSGDDMRWIFGLAVELGALVVHLCAAVEGTYIVACELHGATREELASQNGDDIFSYFSSSHGHRCAPGHEDENYPSADRFVELAHAFRFTGPLCERHAGERATCRRSERHRRLAAKAIGKRQIFFARFVPHELAPRETDGQRTYYGADARAHLARINAYAYDHAGTIRYKRDGPYVALRVRESRRPIV